MIICLNLFKIFALKKSTLLHLRIPFSYYLLPVFLFACSQTPTDRWFDLILIGIILHLLVYPASNGYNSYFDKDEGSIGGLEKPPPVDKELYHWALGLDLLAIILALYFHPIVPAMLLTYGLVSKAYSHPSIRLKKYPIISWLTAGFFQGAFVYFTVFSALTGLGPETFIESEVLIPALLSSAMLLGSYPMTQIYQHSEDRKRGDHTLSLLLGIKGTFVFTAVVFGATALGFSLYFLNFRGVNDLAFFHLGLLPVLLYFFWWARQVWIDQTKADFRHTMRLNALSAHGLNACFIGMWVL